jgi:hypothetical protein
MPVTPPEFNFNDAPSGEFSLDDIFAPDNNSAPQNTTVTPPTDTAPVAEPEPLLKTSTGTVYKTVDDAVAGIEHKDALIAQLRQQVQEATNVDPLKKKPETVDPALISYVDNPKQYFEDIKSAKSEADLLKVQGRFVDERLAPYAPIIASVVKSQAIEGLEREVPKIREFLSSDAYKQTLEAFPLLKTSIGISEQYPERSGDLAQLYLMAVQASAGRALPKVVSPGGSTTPVQTRPTVTSSPATPPPTTVTALPSFGSKEGRKAIIEQQEANGVGNLRF